MTNPTPEATAFRAKMEAERKDWPLELIEAATFLRCELECVPYKGWHETGGPARLGKYAREFERLYEKWRGAP